MIDCYPDHPGPYFIRIYTHNICTNNGTGGQDEDKIKAAVTRLQNDFAPHNIFFVWDCEIDCMNSSTWYQSQGIMASDLITLNNQHNGPADGINIYFFPDENWTVLNGIAVGVQSTILAVGGRFTDQNNDEFNSIDTRVLSHEMGHCLGLYHTFENLPDAIPNNSITCCSPLHGEKADGSNGCDCGDWVADTRAFPGTVFNALPPACNFSTTLQDCNNQTYDPDERNIMNYAHVGCINYFTMGQGARMRWVIATDPDVLASVIENDVFDDVVISSGNTTTWSASTFPPNGQVTIYKSLTIEDGATLTINSGVTVHFGTTAYLDVKQNARLNLSGILTGLCAEPWVGVYVWGDCSKSQDIDPNTGRYYQGRFFGYDRSIIASARTGVSLFQRGASFRSGGQINCTGTIFRNNRIAVDFAPFSNKTTNFNALACDVVDNKNYAARFNRCIFETNDAYLAPLPPFESFIRMRGVRGVLIESPIFRNLKTHSNCTTGGEDNCRGFGIDANLSGFTVRKFFFGQPPIFTGLSYGVYSEGSMKKALTVQSGIFTGCTKGIFVGQSVGADIRWNTFNMGTLPEPELTNGRQWGTIKYQTTGFKYSNNTFVGAAANANKLVGTCSNECGISNNDIITNTYSGLMIGNVANVVNANAAGPVMGLHYQCNKNSGNYGFDFVMPNGGDIVRKVQGRFPAPPDDEFIAAGNTFSYNPNVAESDFANRGGLLIDYYFLPDNPNVPGDENQEPLDFSGLVPHPAFPNTLCNPFPEGDAPIPPLSGSDLSTQKDRYRANKANFGDAMAAYQSANQVGNATLAAQKLNEATYHRQEMDEAARDVLHSLQRDTAAYQPDSVRQWLRNMESFEADVFLVLDYLQSGDAAQAQAAFNAIPLRFALTAAQQQDHANLQTLVSVLSAQSANELDSAAQQTLLGVTPQAPGLAASMAKVILKNFGFASPSPECNLPECCQKSANQIPSSKELVGSQVKVYPNPAQEQVTFEFSTPAKPPHLVRVFDATGALVWQQVALSGQHRLVWRVQDVPPGLYFYFVATADGQAVGSGKVSILK